MKNDTLILAENEMDDEESYRLKINDEFQLEYQECLYPNKGISNLNGKKEIWSINNLKEEKEIIKIESYEDENYFQEIYYSKNGGLIYANEKKLYVPENNLVQQVWSCSFYIKEGEVFTHISLGHGKTELDDWDPSIILEMFEKRKEELRILRNNSNY